MTTQRFEDLTEGPIYPDRPPTRRDGDGQRQPSTLLPQFGDIFETGYYGGERYLGQGGFSGRPQSIEEEQFIIDFVNRYGARPNTYDVSAWQRATQPTTTYAPGSLMHEMGFRGLEDYFRAQKEGLTYGPFTGENVPFGGLVTYDPQGQPLQRYFDPNTGFAARDIGAGRYIPPPGGLGETQRNVFGDIPESQYLREFGTGGDIGAQQGLEQFYPRAGQVEFQAPSFEQAFEQGLVQGDPYELYGTKLYDYLASQQFPQRGAGGEVFQEGMTNEEANEIIDEVERLIKRGVPVEQLPFYNESQESYGTETEALYQSLYENTVTGLREEWEGRRFGFGPTFTSGGRGQRGGGDGAGSGAARPSGTERGDYLRWVRALDLSFEGESWMDNRYNELYNIWLSTGSAESFIDWVSDYLGRGE